MSNQVQIRLSGNRSAEELVDRLTAAALGTFDLFTITLGHRLGYYRALADRGALTSPDLARLTNTNERYTREWLEQQAVTGLLDVDDVTAAERERVYRLPDVYRDVLTDSNSLLGGIPIAQSVVGSVAPFERLVDAYRTGAGLPFSAYGIDMLEGQEDTNRAMFEQMLANDWIPALPDVEARLRQGDGARIADIGMGAGWSSIAFAKAYPDVIVDGFDLDPASVTLAQQNARDEGVADRVMFSTRDAGDPLLAGQYDLVTAFECIHDMANPVGALSSMRRLAGDRGSVLVMDDKVADVFEAPGALADRYLYGFSVLHCLPVGMAEKPSAETGAIMRKTTFADYALEAGFSGVVVLPIETEFSRFYRLIS